MLRTLGAVLFIYLHGCITQPPITYDAPKETRRIARIIDGDTFVVEGLEDRQKETIRLIGIDAPETRRSANKEIGYYGEESKAYLAGLLSAGEVQLAFDIGKKDRYHRTLAYAYLPDGTFINAEMLRRGYATVMTIPPNVTYADWFVELEREAKRKGRGLWKE